MRVAILTQYYPPEPIPKPHELACGLAERGHDVVVVGSFPDFTNSRNPGCRWNDGWWYLLDSVGL